MELIRRKIAITDQQEATLQGALLVAATEAMETSRRFLRRRREEQSRLRPETGSPAHKSPQ